MHEYLFDHIDILPENIHIPDGTVSSSGREQVLEHCRDYEAKIRQAGGIDIQLLGLGREGHIGLVDFIFDISKFFLCIKFVLLKLF